MTIKEKIEEIIKVEPIVKGIYENDSGSFKNVIVPVIENSDDNAILYDLITMLALQCSLYDTVLDNIAKFGNKELIEKCREDLKTIVQIE